MTQTMTSSKTPAVRNRRGTPAPGETAEEALQRRPALARRLVSSAAVISLVVATLFWLPLWWFTLVVLGFTLTALQEFFTIVRHRGIVVHQSLGLALGASLGILVAWRSFVESGLIAAGALTQVSPLFDWLWDVFWPVTIMLLFARQLRRENTSEALSGVATTLLGLVYVGVLFSYCFYVRALDATRGAWLLFYVILVTKMGDAGAYAVGNLIGRTPLMPRISPRKTVEGAVAAVLVSGATGAAAVSAIGDTTMTWWGLAVGVALGVVGQLGDLAESLLKRDCQVKDASDMLPGLGGVLDVLDSLLFTVPVFYAILIYG